MATDRIRAAVADRLRSVRGGLAVLGSTSACSWPVLAVYAPLGIAIQTAGNAGPFGGSPARWMLASAIGMCALGAVLAALCMACRSRAPRPTAVLAVYAIGGITQSVTFGVAAVELGVTDALHLAFRISGLLLHLPLLSAIGYAVCRYDAHRRVVADLERTRARLHAIGRSLDAELERLRAELAGAVRASLDPALVTLDQALAQATRESGRASAIGALDTLVEERVRPLSHELAAAAMGPGELGDDASTVRQRVPLPARFRLADGIAPGVAAIVLAIVALPTALRDLGPAQVPVYDVAFAGGTWVGLSLARRAVRGVELRTPLGIPAVVAVNVAAGLTAFWLVGAVGIERPVGLPGAVAALFTLIGLVTAGNLLVQARRAASETELAEATEQLEHALAVIRRRQRLVARRLAFLVHGSLQGALHAAALRIAEAETIDEALAAGIRRDVDAALTQLDGTPRDAAGRTAATIAEIAGVWGDLRRTTTRIDPAATAALRDDADADEAVAEVVREAVNNAFRHGAASGVEIDVALDDDATVAVTVRDDGGGGGPSPPGLGSALFDDLCRSWSVEGGAGGTIFRAAIPLSRAAAAVGAVGFEPT